MSNCLIFTRQVNYLNVDIVSVKWWFFLFICWRGPRNCNLCGWPILLIKNFVDVYGGILPYNLLTLVKVRINILDADKKSGNSEFETSYFVIPYQQSGSPNQQNGSPLQQNGSQNQQVMNPLQQKGSSRIDKGGRANYMSSLDGQLGNTGEGF